MSVFKDMRPTDILEDIFEAHLKKWLRTYLSEIAEQYGRARGVYPSPKLWLKTPALTTVTTEQLRYPAVIIVSSGLAERPKRRGDGSYDARYTVGVTNLTHANDEDAASLLGRRYSRATETCILQGKDWPSYIDGIDWIDERYTDYLSAEQEAVSSATNIFNVGMKGVLRAHAGPDLPDPLPEPPEPPDGEYQENPTVETVHIKVEQDESLEES